MAAHFLRHEGFLGAVGAFMKVQAMTPLTSAAEKDAGKVGGLAQAGLWPGGQGNCGRACGRA